MESKSIFISTAGTDVSYGFAEEVRKSLKAQGHEVFLYRHPVDGIIPGTDWLARLESELQSADHIVVLITPEYVASKYCMKEYESGLQNLVDFPHIIFPIMVQTTEISNLMNTTQHLSVVNDIESGNLLKAIERFKEGFESFLSFISSPLPFRRVTKRPPNIFSRELFDATGKVIPHFKKEEIGIVIADFHCVPPADYDIAADWLLSLDSEFAELADSYDLRFAHTNQTIHSEEEAKKVLQKYGASIVIWGLISGNVSDDYGPIPSKIRINYTVNKTLPQLAEISNMLSGLHSINATTLKHRVNHDNNTVDLETFGAYIRTTGDIEYMVYVLLGLIEEDIPTAISYLQKALDVPQAKTAKRAIELGVATVYSLQGLMYCKIGEDKKAIRNANTTIFNLKSGEPIAYLIAIASHLNSENEEALFVFIPEIGATDFSMLLPASDLLLHSDIALNYAKMYVGQYPNDANAHLALAIVWDRLGIMCNNMGLLNDAAKIYKKALESLKQVIALNPQLTLAYLLQGFLYRELGDVEKNPAHYDSSLIAFTKAIEIDDTNPSAHFARGVAFQKVRDYKEAERCLLKALKLTTDNPGHDYGHLMENNLLWEVFNNFFNKLFSTPEDFLDLIHLRLIDGYLLDSKRKRVSIWPDSLKKAISHSKKIKGYYRAIALRGIAFSHIEQEKWQEGIMFYDEVISLGEENPDDYYYRGSAYYNIEKGKEAVSDWNRCLELNSPLPPEVQKVKTEVETWLLQQ